MKTGFASGLAVAGLVCLGVTAPQLASAAVSPVGLSAGAEAVAPLVTQVKKKWKGKNFKVKKRGRNIYVAPRRGGRVYVRGWNRRPYYGTFVAGVALGAIITAAAAPPPPADNLCWYWTSPAKNKGYWDYCY